MRSPIIFRIFKNDQIQFVKQFTDKDQIIFGNTTEEGQVDIQLDSPELSGVHCLVEKRGDQYYLCDLGSAVGTLKNNQSVVDEILNSGEEFQIGPFKVVFLSMGAKAQAEPAATEVAQAAVAPAPAPVVTPTKPAIPESAPVYRTAFKSASSSFRKKRKGEQTAYTPSQYHNLKEFIRPGKGNAVQVLISWKGRVLDTRNFKTTGSYKAGPGQDIPLPEGAVSNGWNFLDCSAGARINLSSDMQAEVNRQGSVSAITESSYELKQDEVVYVYLHNEMQLAFRYVNSTALVPLDSPYILTSTEITGILSALIIATLMSLMVSLMTPKKLPVDEEVQRVAQVIFNKPPVPVKPPPVVVPEQKPPEPPKEVAKPPETIKKVVIADKEQEQKNKGNPNLPDQKAQQAQKAGAASEVRPKDPKLKQKMFTSTKQGGAIKTGENAGANAKSKDADPMNSGLLSAFGSGGARSKLDKAYSGSGELLGAGEKATGSSGFNENRAGDDLGSKFKDTGAGGKGTATQGIAGVGTKGRGTGMAAYGSGTGFGSKDQVAIQAGGAEEEFVGSIDREAVRRAVRSAMSAFKACYEREYKKDTKLGGKVVIAWEIHERGVAKNASVVKDKTTIGNAAVEDCVRSRMLTIRFPEPPPGTVAEVVYPFVFQGQQ